MRQLILLLLTIMTSLEAGLDEYLKKAPNKGTCHTLPNIDFIYMINLDQRPEKFQKCLDQLLPYNIHPYRFSAINGWELSAAQISHLGVVYEPWMMKDLMGTFFDPINDTGPFDEPMSICGRTYFCLGTAKGTIGCCLSHLSVLQDAYDSGYETVWIMEDDIEVIRDPHQLTDLIAELDALVGKNEWDILFTDPDTKGQDGNYVVCYSHAHRPNFVPTHQQRFARRSDINHSFRKIGARYGAYSYIIRRRGIEKILNFLKNYQIFLPYDMEFYLPFNIQLYTVREDIVSTQPQALTDNAYPGYLNP